MIIQSVIKEIFNKFILNQDKKILQFCDINCLSTTGSYVSAQYYWEKKYISMQIFTVLLKDTKYVEDFNLNIQINNVVRTSYCKKV